MTLHEFLRVCSGDDYVGILDLDCPFDKKGKSSERFETYPTQQNYFKVKNIPYGRIRWILDKEVCGICHTEKGMFVRIHTAGKASNYLDRHELAQEIAKAIRGR